MRNNRTAEQNSRLFNELNHVINRYVEKKELFCGGCCYAAFILAKCLDNAGIDYKVKVYQDGGFRCRSLKSVCQRGMCAHVAITVDDNGKELILGDTSRVVATLDMNMYFFGNKWRVKEYQAGWLDLENAYYGNEWNSTYDPKNNAYLFGEIQRIFKEY